MIDLLSGSELGPVLDEWFELVVNLARVEDVQGETIRKSADKSFQMLFD